MIDVPVLINQVEDDSDNVVPDLIIVVRLYDIAGLIFEDDKE